MHGGWSNVEREAFVLAVARFVRDFADVGSDYSAFLNKGYEAAYAVQKYHSDALVDLMNKMGDSETDAAARACQRLFYNELLTGKRVPQSRTH